MAGKRVRRWLILIHRWLGIGAALLFAVWFASGLVMVYHPYPSLEAAERLAGQAPLDWSKVKVTPAAALALGGTSGLQKLVLEMRGGQPIWKVVPEEGAAAILSASTGGRLDKVSQTEARAIAAQFAKREVVGIAPVWQDQWTVAERYTPHRPLWQARLAGDDGAHLYVSSTTGEPVLDTAQQERVWNWVGTVPHWIYFTALRAHQPVWRQVIIWLSGPAVVAALTGLWLGLIRLRVGRRRFRRAGVSPYAGWMKWHHIAGVLGGLVLIPWIFSGWLSVDPGRLFASSAPSAAQQAAFNGPVSASLSLAQLQGAAAGARRVTLASAAGRPFVQIERQGSAPQLLEQHTLAPVTQGGDAALQRIGDLYPMARIVAAERITRPDAYWYARRGPLLLPVLRVRLEDDAATWLHIHPDSGEVLETLDLRRRIYRWLFDCLHTWDAPVLLEHPLLREVWIWLFSLLGLITSISGVWLGWKRLTR